ncbi:hypothetical protein FRC00_012709 [Tulasnella sp. 408]|nr:hypothetical protein FRC00_012709 [Tulasnella sp. 408]
MDTTAHILEQPITQLPDIPPEFGHDGGKFYHYYDQLADEVDEDLSKRLKSQLDSLLIFAGLFAGVNSAFLARTLPMMSADPANDTNALLLQLVRGGNGTINSEADLPSATFSPPSAIYPVNVLFAVSLTCALMSSFLAVLGQQWLVYYRNRSGGGAEYQRNEQLARQLRLQRWKLELILDDILPGLLQVGLVIFCISFVLYLRTLSGFMSYMVAVLVSTAFAITVGAAVCATWDPMCPYQSPLSHLLCWVLEQITSLIHIFVWIFVFLKAFFHEVLRRHPRGGSMALIGSLGQCRLATDKWRETQKSADYITHKLVSRFGREMETEEALIVASLERVIFTSEHPSALVYASINLCALDDEESLRHLLNDPEVNWRLHTLFSDFEYLSEASPAATAYGVAATAVAAAIVHMALSVGTIVDLAPPEDRHQAIEDLLPHQLEMNRVSNCPFSVILESMVLNQDSKDRDPKHISHILLLGTLLEPLSRFPTVDMLSLCQSAKITTIAQFTTSHQSLSALTCAIKMSTLCQEWYLKQGEVGRSDLVSQLFELVKTTYARYVLVRDLLQH